LLLTRVLALVLVAGCKPGPPPPTCTAGFIGDAKLPPKASIVFTDGLQPLSELVAGQAVPLEAPPQGGYVIYVGAKVQNMLACVELRGRLRDMTTKEEYGFDARSTKLIVRPDGWGWPSSAARVDVSDLANVNPCPDYKARDVTGQTYELQMVVTDQAGRQVEVLQPVVPGCMQADSLVQKDCVCTCSANYTLGRCNPGSDGGTVD
jgi:hypothetical protein